MKKTAILCLVLILLLSGSAEIFALDFSAHVQNQFLKNASQSEKDRVNAVYEAQKSTIWRDFYDNQRYDWTKYGSHTEFDFENVYSTFGLLLPDRFERVEEGSYSWIYDAIHYAQRGEFDLLLRENPDWEIPVYFGEQYTTTVYTGKDNGLVVPNDTWGQDYTTLDFLNAVREIQFVTGLENIELLKFIRHREGLIYVYIKADGKDYAIPYKTGNQSLWFANCEKSGANFEEIEYGKLYKVEDLYTIILKVVDKRADTVAENKIMHFDYFLIGGIAGLKHAYDAPSGTIHATAGQMAEKLQNIGLLKGDGDGLAIHSTLTRAEGITMLLRLMGAEEAANKTEALNVFSDVDNGHWARNNIVYAYDKGLVKGTTETTFSPEDKLSASQFMVMLLRAMGYDNYQGEALTLENANAIAQKIGFNTQFSEVVELKRGHMAEMASRALQVTTASGQMVAEILLQNGTITNEQFACIVAPDFYTVPYTSKKETFKIEGYPAFPEVGQKHYAIYKEATRDNRIEIAFFDIAEEKGDEMLLYDESSLTLSDNERYINSVKYVLSGTVWIKFEEGYPAISNYASEVLLSDLPILKNGQPFVPEDPKNDKIEKTAVTAKISADEKMNYAWSFPLEYQFIKADEYASRIELVLKDGTVAKSVNYEGTQTKTSGAELVRWLTEQEPNSWSALQAVYYDENNPLKEYVLWIDISNITVKQEGTAPEPGQYIRKEYFWDAQKIMLAGWDMFDPDCYYVLVGRETGRSNGLVCKQYLSPHQASNSYTPSMYEHVGVYYTDEVRLQEIRVQGNFEEGFVICITPESEKAFEIVVAEENN